MLKNFIIITLRNFRKNKLSTSINVIGLVLGFFAFITLTSYVFNETSYDTWHKQADNIFRHTTIDEALGVSSNMVAITSPRMPKAAEEELAEVTTSARMIHVGDQRLERGDRGYYATQAKYVEADFFNIFDLKVQDEGVLTQFDAPRKIILSESFSKTIFPDVPDVTGELVTIDDDSWEIVGIMDDVTKNSHLQFDMLMSLFPAESDSSFADYLDSWNGLGMIGYIVLEDPSQEANVEDRLKEISLNNDVNDFWVPQLQPVTDIHLGSSDILFDGYHVNKGDATYVYALGAVALFVLLIAAFNFMNLTTAQSTTRAKEVGIRKVLGSGKKKLMGQHLTESVTLSVVSLCAALLLVLLVSRFLDLGLDFSPNTILASNLWMIGAYLLVAVAVGLGAGLYPAFVLSGFDAIRILRGKFQTSSQGVLLRKSLVILQFVASVVMIITTLLVSKQIDYIRNKNLGFDKEQVINLNFSSGSLIERMDVFREEALKHPSIGNAAYSSNMPGRTFGRTGMTLEGGSEDEDIWIVSAFSVDQNYFNAMGIEVVEGRNYSTEYGSDQQESIIINRAMLEALNWDYGVGKPLTFGETQRTVVGVIEDFHFASMRHKIEPLVIYYNPEPASNLNLKITTSEVRPTLEFLEAKWTETFPNYPFEYQFFDQEFDQLFESDQQFAKMVNGFTLLSIVLSCLGLFGLSSFTAEQRRKEIGVRKVLGSSVYQIVSLLMREFILLIAIASLIAWPISYWSLNSWIQDFQYRIEIVSPDNLFLFGMAAVGAMIVAVLAVSYKSISAAVVNPVRSLRDE
ncbi:MAG: FtsX-like permease family protein [Cyclobacteriaceae bacterium]